MPRTFWRCLVTFALTLLGAPPGAAAQPATLHARGLSLGYNLDYPAALETFNQAIAADATDIAAYRLSAATSWIALLFEQGAVTVDDYLGQARSSVERTPPNPAMAAALQEHLQKGIALAEARLKTHPTDPMALYEVGAAYGLQASYIATVEGKLSASFGPARRAYKAHERLLGLDHSRKDAGLIVGLYRYTVATLSLPARVMARLAGFGSGRERGIALVEAAAAYPGDAQPGALFTLALIYNREKRYDDALRVIGELQRMYPRNRLLWLEAASTGLRAGRPADARMAVERGLALLAAETRPLARGEESRWRYVRGAALAALNQRGAAEAELQEALALATRDWVRGRVRKELGRLSAGAGDRQTAAIHYTQAERLCRADHDDECADEARALMRRKHP
jgi:tetratricopeptide (TPR) repeat protein